MIGLAVLACLWPLRRYGRSLAVVAELPELRAARRMLGTVPPLVVGYLKSLLPGWFVVHGVLAGLGAWRLSREFGWFDLVPQLFGVLVGLICVVAGHKALHDRRWLWLVLPASAYAIGFAVKMISLAQYLHFR